MKKVRNTNQVPKGGWTYTDPDSGDVLQSPYYNVLKGRAKDYRRANNYPIGLKFDDDFEAIICAANPEACIDFEEPSLATRAQSLATAMAKWAMSGFKVRTKEQYESAIQLCRECNYYDGESGLLKIACKQCKCSSKKIGLASEHCPIGKW